MDNSSSNSNNNQDTPHGQHSHAGRPPASIPMDQVAYTTLYTQLISQVQNYNMASTTSLPPSLVPGHLNTFPMPQLYGPPHSIHPAALHAMAMPNIAAQAWSYYNAPHPIFPASLLPNPLPSAAYRQQNGTTLINNIADLTTNQTSLNRNLNLKHPSSSGSDKRRWHDDDSERHRSPPAKDRNNRRDSDRPRRDRDDRDRDRSYRRNRSRSRSRSRERRFDRRRRGPSEPRSRSDRGRDKDSGRSRDRDNSHRGRDRCSTSENDTYRKRKSENNSHDKGEDDSFTMKRARMADLEKLLNSSSSYIRCFPLEPYYKQRSIVTGDVSERVVNIAEGSEKLVALRNEFKRSLLDRAESVRNSKPKFSFPQRPIKLRRPHKHGEECGQNCDSESDTDEDGDDHGNDSAFQELQRKKSHPWRLHDELWYNDKGEMNDGPVCRCSLKAQRSGIRHGIYLGEEHLPKCDPNTNNRNRLHHYLICIKPSTNFLTDSPTVIDYDGHSYFFEGYSLFSHFPISAAVPLCKIIRYNIEYTISFVEAEFPQNFCVGDIDYFCEYVFHELLELADLDMKAKGDTEGCNRFHFLPRFTRILPDNGKELLSMNVILEYLNKCSQPLIDESKLDVFAQMDSVQWSDFTKQYKGQIVTCPGMKPSSIRVDQIDRERDDLKKPSTCTATNSESVLPCSSSSSSSSSTDGLEKESCNSTSNAATTTTNSNDDEKYPVLVHFGIRPPQLSYAGNPRYQKAWRDYVKFRHLLANKDRVLYKDKQMLASKETKLQELRSKSDLKRDVTVVVSSKGFYGTGLQCDVVQHSLLVPVLVCHLRFHYSLQYLEQIVGYSFKDRTILQLALTHPSYRENFGTNPDHARNTLTNCGLRHLEYGDRRVHFMNTRKRGINMLINIMSRFGCNEETVSNINHNERLEFLGDAVVEFLTSIHLFFLFPDLEEGGLATYRAALVQNQHLAVLARKLQLEKFMLYAHGSDLCHDLELRHAMANCFEAFMGALFLDGGIEVADAVFSRTLFDNQTKESRTLHEIWVNYPRHPLQLQYPDGDRCFIDTVPRLQELVKFEELIGVEFKHIRLLARAFTHRSIGYNNLTLGSNQRMEFLGDTVLQLIASEYLYKFFPDHHEGHLSLLRSSLVNNKTQSVVCDDLGIAAMTHYNSVKSELKTKDRADLLEAFIGALYVDKGVEYCRKFCEVCFFPRLEHFIMNQDWNDPKSKLQQCCLTLRSANGGEPDIPMYKVIESKGPTNTRIYVVAVYFRDKRLATGKGHSIQEAEMNAATNALTTSKELFPQLMLQKKVIKQKVKRNGENASDSAKSKLESSS